MALPIKLLAAVTTTTVAASAAAYIAINSQSIGGSPTATATAESRPAASSAAPSSPVDGPQTVKVCVASDRILHANREGEDHCPAGQQELVLADSDAQLCDSCDPMADSPAPASSDDLVLEAMTQIVKELENTAYFEVINENTGLPLFTIGGDGARVYNPTGRQVARFQTTAAGGNFTVTGENGKAASIGATNDNAMVRFFDQGVPRAEIGRANGGSFAFRLPSASGVIAGLGQSAQGTGALVLGNLAGVRQGTFTVSNERGMVALDHDTYAGGVVFAETTIGGGLLEIANRNGDWAVKMGHNDQRYGIVMAGPILGYPLVPRSGQPGSYFVGCASGERPACLPNLP